MRTGRGFFGRRMANSCCQHQHVNAPDCAILFALTFSLSFFNCSFDRFTYEIAPIFILMEHEVLKKMRQIIGFENGDSILAPGQWLMQMSDDCCFWASVNTYIYVLYGCVYRGSNLQSVRYNRGPSEDVSRIQNKRPESSATDGSVHIGTCKSLWLSSLTYVAYAYLVEWLCLVFFCCVTCEWQSEKRVFRPILLMHNVSNWLRYGTQILVTINTRANTHAHTNWSSIFGFVLQSHYSTKGAGAVCGFGTNNVKEVPCDER